MNQLAGTELPWAQIRSWLQQQRRQQMPAWRAGHQGQLLRYQDGPVDVVIKCPQGRGLRGWWSRWTVRHEYRAYQRLDGVAGIPRCHGLIDDAFLVLDYIPAQSYRQAQIADRDAWFQALLTLIRRMHDCGVAHGDLKRKANLLVDAAGRPVVVDFGTAWLRQPGFRPFNAWLFRFLCRTDLNAYVKHKYHGRYAHVAPADRALLRYSRLESWINRWRHWREERRIRRAARQKDA